MNYGFQILNPFIRLFSQKTSLSGSLRKRNQFPILSKRPGKEGCPLTCFCAAKMTFMKFMYCRALSSAALIT